MRETFNWDIYELAARRGRDLLRLADESSQARQAQQEMGVSGPHNRLLAGVGRQLVIWATSCRDAGTLRLARFNRRAMCARPVALR